MINFNRRQFLLSGIAAGLLAPASTNTLAADKTKSVIWGPPATPSIIPAFAIAKGMLGDLFPNCEFKIWASPDQMRAGLISGDVNMAIMPSYTGANLYNKGAQLRLANTLTEGLLYIVAAQASGIETLNDLKEKTIAVPFKNDMPDLVFRAILKAHDVAFESLKVIYIASPAEAIPLLMIGRVDAAVLVEPACSAAIFMSQNASKKIERVLDLQKLWQKVSGNEILAQAGLLVGKEFAHQQGYEKVVRLNEILLAAKDEILSNKTEAAEIGSKFLGFPAKLIEPSLDFSNLVVKSGVESRSTIEQLFKVLYQENPDILGGKMPDDGFYGG